MHLIAGMFALFVLLIMTVIGGIIVSTVGLEIIREPLAAHWISNSSKEAITGFDIQFAQQVI